MGQSKSAAITSGESRERVGKVQKFVQEKELGALLVYSGPKAHMWYQSGHVGYLTNWSSLDRSTDAIVVIPETGDVTLLCPGADFMLDQISQVSWVQDIRLVASSDPKAISAKFDEGAVGAGSTQLGRSFGDEIVEILEDRDFGERRVGLVGIENLPVPIYRNLTAHLGNRLVEVEDIVARLRYVKSPAEIELIRETARIADMSYSAMLDALKPGLIGYQLSAEMERFARACGADFASFTLASGPAEDIARGSLDIKAHARQLCWGDQILVNTYLMYKSYFIQPVRSGTLGPASREQEMLMGACLEIQDRCIETMKPGIPVSDIVKVARAEADRLGYDLQGGRIGHGQGLDYAEWPYFLDTNMTLLEPGVVAVIHPPVTVPGTHFLYSPIGDVVLVTERGAERLNKFPREPFHVGL
jgi:Xaa-Pro aminopeptidase